MEARMCIYFTSRQTKIMTVKKSVIKKICIRDDALTLSVHTQTHTQTHTYLVQSSTKAGDVGATTRGCYNAVARPTRNVVINLCPYNEIITLQIDR